MPPGPHATVCFTMGIVECVTGPCVPCSPVPTQIRVSENEFLSDVVEIDTGFGNATICAIRSDDSLWCWGGRDRNITLDVNGNYSSDVFATWVADGIADIHSAQSHMCAQMLDGTVWCRGSNSSGLLGNSSVPSSGSEAFVPVTVHGLEGEPVKSLESTSTRACVIRMDDSAVCWGYGDVLAGSSLAEAGGAFLVRAGNNTQCGVSLGTNRLQCWGICSSARCGVDEASLGGATHLPPEDPGFPQFQEPTP